jgi:general secretion pathway protein D
METKRRVRWAGVAAVALGAAVWTAAAEGESTGALLQRSRLLALAGDDEPAAAAYREVLAREPGNAEAATFLARIERQGRGERWRTREELLRSVAGAWTQAPTVATAASPEASGVGAAAELERRLEAIVLPEVSFSGASLSSALATLGSLAAEHESATGGRGVNLVLLDPGNANPPVQLDVRGLSLRRVLDFLTAGIGYSYEVQADAVVIRPGNANGPLETAVLPLSGAIVARMVAAGTAIAEGDAGTPTTKQESERRGREAAALRTFLQQAGVRFDGVEGSSLVFDGSAILVTQTPQNLARLRTILARYTAVRQVEIEAKFLEVEDGALEELGVNWAVSRRKDAAGVPQERYLTGNRSVADAFGGSASGGAIQIDGASVASVAAPVLPGEVPLGAGTKPLAEISGFIGEFDVSATVRALAQKKGSDLLSAPKVTVISGHAASITVARQLRYPRQYGQIQSQVGQAGGGENSSSAGVTITAGTPQDFVTENVGVDLQVTPVVEEDARSITLDLHPVVTEFEGFVEYGGPSLAVSGGKTVTIPSGFYQPIFSKRSVSTRVTLWDGATLVMGGLTREETKKVTDKVPLLGDLPAVGRLFRSSGEGATKRNLLIFVTASLVSPGGGGLRKLVPPSPAVTTVEPSAAPAAEKSGEVAAAPIATAKKAK